jgi:chemotaxis family two-component system response regulator Rcp1
VARGGRAMRQRSFTILLVDDSAADARLMREALADTGVPPRLCVVTDGEEALAFVRREGVYAAAPWPDLVITDLNMPRLSGHDLIRILKGDVALRRLPVLRLTTSSAPEDSAIAYALHANACLTKPADFDAFCTMMQAVTRFWGATAPAPRDLDPAVPALDHPPGSA